MSKQGDDVVQLLIDTGVLTPSDATYFQEAQSEALLNLMLERRAILPDESSEAQTVLTELLTTSNHSKSLRARMVLVRMITTNLHRRMDRAGARLREQKERITSGAHPAVAMCKVNPKR